MIQTIAQSLYTAVSDETLYHYTSISGFKGIIESQCLWASDVRYMNDAAELKYIINLLREGSSEVQQEKKLLGHFIDWMEHRITNGNMVFAASFRAHGNLLSQWRGYSRVGKGISIGFNSCDILRIADSSGFQLGRCIYQRETQMLLINRIIEHIIERAGNAEPSMDNDSLFNSIEADMLRIAVLLKHPSFAEEDEWRLVSPVITDYLHEPVGFREGNSMLIPYYKIPMLDENSNSINIEHLFLGPTPNSVLSLNSIRLYLAKQGVEPDKGISYCEIPYRNR